MPFIYYIKSGRWLWSPQKYLPILPRMLVCAVQKYMDGYPGLAVETVRKKVGWEKLLYGDNSDGFPSVYVSFREQKERQNSLGYFPDLPPASEE